MRRRLLKLCYQTISKLRLKKEEENKIELMNICISFTMFKNALTFSLACLELEMRRQLIIHETGFTC